jgi:hypothetical protein
MKPWYREPWPWLLMSGPAAVLVAGAVTTWLAFASSDGLVAEDYYRQGLGINKVLAREEAAKRLGVDAEVLFEKNLLRVNLTGQTPEVIFVRLAHATRAGYDQRLRLTPVSAGVYEAALPDLPAGRWRAVVEDARSTWRVARDADDPAPRPVYERLSYWSSEIFAPRTATLTPEGRRTLGEAVLRARRLQLEVVIALDYGELAAPRAAALREFLVSSGIAANRVYTEGVTSKARARVEIEIIGSQ